MLQFLLDMLFELIESSDSRQSRRRMLTSRASVLVESDRPSVGESLQLHIDIDRLVVSIRVHVVDEVFQFGADTTQTHQILH